MKDTRLYINNKEIEFSNAPDVLFTFQEDDLTNPTIVKNSYTKTITIPGTPNNNNIFNGIWNVERIQGDDNFNVTKRVPFSLYVNGDIYQTGYAKLDKISRNNNKIEYSITLYGGLGQFLYNLSIDWNSGDKKTLADMDYFKSTTSEEAYDLGFTINKDTVASAWTQINSNDKWGVVNFAPTYLGYPDKISCDKVLINFSGNSMTSAVTDGSSAFTPSGGFALGTSPQKLTSEEVRDYRSYIQTPVMRVHSIIDAICRKENNAGRYDEGYEVVLDNEFFNTANPYYWDAWVTLPTITNLEFSSEGGGGTTTAYTANPVSSELDANGNCLYTFELSETITGGNISVKATIDLGVTGTTNSDVLYFYYTHRYGRGQKVYKRNAYGLQLYASNSVTSSENVLAGSNVKWLSGEQRYTYADAISSGQFTPKWNTNVVENHTGYFTRVSGSTFHYTGTSGNLIELRCDLPIGTRYFKLFMKRCNSSNNSERNMLFTSTEANTGDKITVVPLPFNSKTIELSSIDSGASISNKYISKEMLLSTSYSPADWLLSYCKKFGLYIKKDVIDDKIYILTRNNYYKRDNIIDIEKDIDLSKTFDINPVYCQNGYLSLTDEGVESKSESDYTQKTGKIYGQKIVNTGYEFNADTKELNNGIFKNAVQTKDVSQYYYRPNASGLYPYVYNGFKYNLYENGDYSGSTKEYNQPSADIAQTFQPFDENFPNYDFISKPMFSDTDGKSLDTENVLLFFNGYENVSLYNWMLTDDIAYMYKLNNNPTWLLTLVEEDIAGNKIAKKITNFPRFSRWLEGNRWMIYSFDYGSPRLLYVPEMTNNDEGNVYWNYYKKYYEDLYDVDTKVVDCNTLGKFNEESLRYVYWFRNRYWRLNKITDYNPTSYDTTKTQFISLNDINSLTNENATTELWMKVTLDKYILPQSGGTIVGTVRTSDNYGWNIEGVGIVPTGDTAYTITVEPEYWGSSGNFFITAGTNDGMDKLITIYLTAGDIGKSVQFIQDGAISAFEISPSALTFDVSGGTETLSITNYIGYEWEVVGQPNWVTFSPSSGSATASTISIIASANEGDERTGSFVIWNRTKDETYVVPLTQRFAPYLRLVPSATTFSSSGGTAIINVESNIDWSVRIYSELSAITIDNLTITNDVPASGGTVDSASCTYSVTGYYEDGTTEDITTAATVTGSITIPSSTAETRHSAGTLTLTATYSGFTASASATVYQEAYVKPTPPKPKELSEYLTFEILSNGTIVWITSNSENTKTIQYSKDSGETWTSVTSSIGGTAINVSTGDVVLFMGNNEKYGLDYDVYNSFIGTASFNVRGNIMSLVKTNFEHVTTGSSFAFNYLFAGSKVADASHLVLPIDEVGSWAYGHMFDNCTSLQKSPYIMASSFARNACYGMFSGCTSLNHIKCITTGISASNCTKYWVKNVASSGTFVKDADMTSWTTGDNGIPSGWTVVDNSDAGELNFILSSTSDLGDFNIEVTATGVDEVVNVNYDDNNVKYTIADGFTTATTFSVGVQNLDFYGLGSRHIGISYAYTPIYNFVEVPAGQFTWQSDLQYEQGKIIYIQVY